MIAYQIVGKFFSATPSLVVYDARGQKVGCLRKKIFTLRSPLDRYDGDNIEFEIEIQGEVLGSLRNKKLGGAFDGPLQKMSDSKEGFAGKRYEYDFADWTLIDRTLSSGFDIVSGDGKRFAKIERNSWERGDSYVLSYSSKKDEILLLMMLLAMDALYDTETKKDKVSRAVWLGSSPR